ncbi:cell division protein ZapE [Zobellella maritima]|uniref:cell division protein ZapE n=1 Tax=Zobellella maritima TaxID=2059725 RepID=UPI000E3055C9|nr:cell division protein ZapE [Zobellella maritima]
MIMLSPQAAWEQAVNHLGFSPDPGQQQAVEALEHCYRQLHQPEADGGWVAGIYLWGPVGRGKTWLMDCFHQGLTLPCRRQHFHHFMRWVHKRLFQLTGTPDPLQALARELAREVRVLCLDELFVSDIGDAMILGRLLRLIFEQGTVLVVTSNQPPEQLYADGYNRDRFVPAVVAMQAAMQVVAVDGGQDHRLHPGESRPRYWVNDGGQPGALAAEFTRLSAGGAHTGAPLVLGHRAVSVVRRSERVLWCHYQQLCEQPLAAMDFIELCDRYAHILLSDLPCLSQGPKGRDIARGTEDGVEQVAAGERRLPVLSRQDDGVCRFIALVDECYDRGIPLYLEARVPLDRLYGEGYLSFPFRRTLSRLQEMQLARFGERRPASASN